MKTDTSFICALLILAFSQLSFQWPVENARLTSTYGESRSDHFHDGIDLISPADAVYPLEQARLVYLWDKALFPDDNYPGGGNFKILAGKGGNLSVYMHLQDGIPLKREALPKEALGYIGNTGHSFAKHLHVSMIDPKKSASANPLLSLPPYADTRSPEIGEMCLRIEDKYVIIRDKSTIRLTKHYPMLVKIVDSTTGGEKLGVYSLNVRFNGKDVLSETFDALVSSPRGILAAGKVFDTVYDPEGYYKIDGITYLQGVNTFEITAADFSGNKTAKTFQLTVNLDMAPAGK